MLVCMREGDASQRASECHVHVLLVASLSRALDQMVINISDNQASVFSNGSSTLQFEDQYDNQP